MGEEAAIDEEGLDPRDLPEELVPELSPEQPDDAATSLVRHSAVMSVGTALSRLTGFLRLAAAAWALGITETRLADAYNIANTTPNIIYELALGGILSSVFVPVFVEWLKVHGKEDAWDLARRFLTFAVVVLGVLTVAGILLAPAIMRLYTIGITDVAQREYVQDVGTFFLRFFVPQIMFYGIGAVATGLLNAHRRFAAPMFAPILNNVMVIATMITFGLMAGTSRGSGAFAPTTAEMLLLAIGTTLGVVGMTAALWPSLRRLGFRFHWRNPRHEGVRRVAHLAKWVAIYVATNQAGYLVVLLLAAPERGGYTAYSMAFIMFQLPHAIFAVSIFTALLPTLSSRWTDGDTDGFRSILAQGLRLTGFIVIPAALGYLVLAAPITRLLFQHGATTDVSTELVAQTLQAMALGLFSFSAFQLLLRAFYAMQDTRTPATVNVGAVAVNTLANMVLVGTLGVQGLALGLAVAYSVGAVILAALMARRLGGLEGRRILATLARVLVLGIVTAGAALVASVGLGSLLGHAGLATELVQVLGSVAVGLLVFVVTASVLRMEELTLVKTSLSSRFRT
ncbi:MAG: murein biosynthesis integral membrane protein MurJ [Actinomycetota bacterium]